MVIPIQRERTSPELPDPAISLDIPVQLRLPTQEREIEARLSLVDRGFLKLSVPVALPEGLRAEIAFDGCGISAEVVLCERNAPDRFTVAMRRVYSPGGVTRGEPRIRVDFSAILISQFDSMFARIVDMSQSGLGLELPDLVAVGTRISVQFVCGMAFGQIKHCTAKSAVYRVGIRIDEFVVRRGSGGLEKRAEEAPERNRRYERVMRYRLAKVTGACIKRVFCFVAGHEYWWFTDQWARAVLRCRRCEKLLSP